MKKPLADRVNGVVAWFLEFLLFLACLAGVLLVVLLIVFVCWLLTGEEPAIFKGLPW
jgi:uncharacterized RDD family membrane protein YckC